MGDIRVEVEYQGDLHIPWVPQCQVWGEHGTMRTEDIRVGTENLHISWMPPCQLQAEHGTGRMGDIQMEMRHSWGLACPLGAAVPRLG